mgnify:CR=1 FL=1
MMFWTSMSDFLAMGGHGLYVWGSFGVTAVALAVELWAMGRRRQQALTEVRNWRLLNDDGAAR